VYFAFVQYWLLLAVLVRVFSVRCEDLTVVTVRIPVLWDVRL
jgi:hypothetical protein